MVKTHSKKEIILLICLIFSLFILDYPILDKGLENFLKEDEFGIVERVVDGDTLIINGNSTRLLGVNTPEKGEKYYNEAKTFLEQIVLNRTVRLEYENKKYDQYGRKLAYIFLDEKNVNEELIKSGFANIYILGYSKYREELEESWLYCLKEDIGLCKKSIETCAKCINLDEINVKEQKIILKNNCIENCNLTNWSIKDEGRKKFIFPNFKLDSLEEVQITVTNSTTRKDNITNLYWKNKDYVWTKEGDTLFLRDDKGFLVLWKNY
jgi:micrococcal nuclease